MSGRKAYVKNFGKLGGFLFEKGLYVLTDVTNKALKTAISKYRSVVTLYANLPK